MPTAYLALGSNLGKRQTTLRAALERIGQLPTTKILNVATFRFTTAVGGPANQPDYLNGAVAIDTQLTPQELLAALLKIEHDFGRDRTHETRHGPRVVDLDLLLYDDLVVNEPGLTVPHPRLHERAFVLDPLAEIAGTVVHPTLHRTIAALREELKP